MFDSEWKAIDGTNGRYSVSSDGRVRSNVSNCELRPTVNSKGYRIVRMADQQGGKVRNRRVHVLVLEAFDRPRPEGMITRHLNGDPGDNRIENLRWGTHSENEYDQILHGTHWASSITHCKNGHEYAKTGVTFHSDGKFKVCLQCRRERQDRNREAERLSQRERWSKRTAVECEVCGKSLKQIKRHMETMHGRAA